MNGFKIYSVTGGQGQSSEIHCAKHFSGVHKHCIKITRSSILLVCASRTKLPYHSKTKRHQYKICIFGIHIRLFTVYVCI